jgi:UrcA family protein
MEMFMEARKNRHAGILATLLVAGVGLVAAPRSPATEVLHERVRIADLDLASPAGEREFERRVRAAIKRVCEAPHGVAARSSTGAVRACRSKALDGVHQQLRAHGISTGHLVTRN